MSAVLDLLTLNLWGLPWPMARRRRERKRRFADHVGSESYDLVGLQELWWPWSRALAVTPLTVPRSRRDSGLALLGRLRLREEARLEHFRERAGLERVKHKGFLRAPVEVATGSPFVACVTHLQAGVGRASARAEQVSQLLASLDRERLPIVLMGDFNFFDRVEEDARSAQRLAAAGFLDLASALQREEPTFVSTNRYVRAPCRERFDRIYLRQGDRTRLEPLDVEVLQPDPHPLSDHHPLRARVELVE